MKKSLLVQEAPAIYKVLTRPLSMERRALRSLGTWIGGGTPSKGNPSFWAGGTIPWVSPKDLKVPRIRDAEDHITVDAVASSTTNLIKAGAVVLVVRSGILKHSLPVAVTDVDVALNQDMKALQPIAGVDAAYVAWALRASAQQILHGCTKAGTTVQSIEMPTFLDFEIPLPSLEQQRAVVAMVEARLSLLDASVSSLRRVQANLKRYRASVLKSACEGRLVPTEAELARQEGRDFETGAQLLQRILAERRARSNSKAKYKDPIATMAIDAPELPAGWIWASLEQLTHLITSGSRGWGGFYSETGVLFVRAQDIKTDALNVECVARVEVPKDAEGTRSSVGPNDILISITGANVTKSALVPDLAEAAFVSQHVALLKLSLQATAAFVFNWIVSPANGRRALEAWAYGAGKPGLSLEQVRALPVALPPLAEQHRIVAEADRRLSQIRVAEAQVAANLARTQRLRQSILQAAFAAPASPR